MIFGRDYNLTKMEKKDLQQGLAFIPALFLLNKKLLALAFYMGLFCTGCLPPSLFPSPSEIKQRSQAEKDSRGRRSARSQFTLRDKACSENSECPDICEKIFERRTEKDECEDRSVSEVREFEKIFDFFKGKDASGKDISSNAEYFGNLARIGEEDFNEFVDISENLNELINEIPALMKATFRNWVADNSAIAEIFKSKDGDFAVFSALFGSSCADVDAALNTEGYVERKPDPDDGEPKGVDDKNPDDVAREAGNRDFLQWVHDYLRAQPENYTPPDPRELIDNNDLSADWCS
ncbi:MAG: hypothetical protein OXB86_05390 [Bdellovibrionales bacterium]|nr:hypothetical protein [Bdellovibrionales bacterium]